MSPKRRIIAKLGELLLDKQVITKKQLEDALELQRTKYKRKFLGQILVEQGSVGEEEIYNTLATQLGYPYIKVSNCIIDPQVLNLIPLKTAEEFNVMPIDRIGNILTLAMLNPLETTLPDKIEQEQGLKVKIFVTRPSELKEAIATYYTKIK